MIAAIFLLAATLAVPVVFSDSEPVKGYLLQKVGDAIGGYVTAKHLELQLFASPKVKLNQLVLKEHEKGRLFLRLEDGDCEFEFRALAIGQVVINQCTLIDPDITLRRGKDGAWSWFIFPETEEDSGMSLVKFAGLKNFGVTNGRITMIDESDPQHPRFIVFSHLEAIMTMKLESHQINVQASVAPPDTGGNPSTLSIDGRIQIPAQVERFSVQHATAKIKASDVELRPILEFFEPGIEFTAQNPEANLQTTLSFFPDQAGYTLVAEELSTRIGELGINGKSSVTGLLSQQPAFLFTATVPKFRIKALTQLIPSPSLPEGIQDALTQYQHGGNVQVEHITVSGPMTDDTDLSVIGKFIVSNGWVNFDSSFPTLQNIHGSVVLNHDELSLNDVSLEYESSKILNARGHIELNELHPSLTLTANAKVLPEDVLKTARRYYEGKQDPPIWLDMQDVEGDADLTLTIGGPLTDPEQLNVHHGELVVRNLGFRPRTYALAVRAISGHMRFNQDHLTIDSFSAEYEGSRILQASGRIEFREPHPMLIMSANANILAKDILKTAHQLDAIKHDPPVWLDLQQVEGHALVDLKIKGPLTEPGELKIDQGELTVQNLGFETPAFPLAVQNLSGEIGLDQDQAEIHVLRGNVGESRTTLQGAVSYGQQDKLKDVRLQSQIELSDLQRMFPEIFQESGLSGGPIDMTMALSGSTELPDIKMSADLTPVKISYPSILQKPAGIQMGLKFDGALMPNHVLNIHQSTLEISPFHLDIKGKFSVGDSRIVDVTLTTGPDNGSRFPVDVVAGQEQLGLRHMMANVSIKGSGKDWMAWKTSGIIDLNKQSSIAAQTSTDPNKTGRVQWTQEDNKATLHVRTQDFPMEAIIPKENSKEPKITGNLTMDISLETALSYSQPLTQAMLGKGEFQIRDGHVVQSPVISRILGLLNLPNLLMGKVNLAKEGVPFNALTGTFTVTNGRVTSNNLLLNSPVIKMTAAGNYDLPTDQLDFIVAVSPFGEYSNLLKSIPLFGRLLKGERKGLTTALFEVKGSREKPDVTYQPLKSFTEGLQGVAQFAVDVLKNTITLPKDLITEPEEENVSSQ